MAGSRACQSVGADGPQGTDFWVNFEVDENRNHVTLDGFGDTYDYVVTPDGIETSDASGGGWKIEGSLEVPEREDLRAFVTSLTGGGIG